MLFLNGSPINFAKTVNHRPDIIMKKLAITAMLALYVTSVATASADIDTRWGDQGDGTFANPVLAADYSDPEVIRVGDKYYLTCSEFHFMGIPILVSDDMVNWRLLTQVYTSMEGYDGVDRYGDGSWAPSLRYHDGRFYLYFCTPNDGLFMTSAEDAAGPWQPLHHVRKVSGWEDPCPLWDDEGNAWLGRSQLGGGPIIIHRMSPDGKRLLDGGREVYNGPTAEGTKLFIKDGYFYLSIPEGGVGTGWQTVGRSKSIYGPYDMKRVLEQGSTNVNGPHQGALVDTPDGEWWFYHFQSTSPLGRVTHLQPVKWVDGYPVIGEDYDGNGIGEPMKIVNKPSVGATTKPHTVATSDDFDNGIGNHWQFNHNPDMSKVTVTDGQLVITPSKASSLRSAPNMLTQKTMGYSGEVTVKADVSKLEHDGRAGLLCIGNKTVGLGVRNTYGTLLICTDINGTIKALSKCDGTVWLRYTYDVPSSTVQPWYSVDGVNFKKGGDPFQIGEGDWKGARFGLYAFTKGEANDNVTVAFDDFTYITDHISHSSTGHVDNVSNDSSRLEIAVEGRTVTVTGAGSTNPGINIYSTDGQLCTTTCTNRPVTLSQPGVYIVAPAAGVPPSRKIAVR